MTQTRSTDTTFQRLECVGPDHSESLRGFIDIRLYYNPKAKQSGIIRLIQSHNLRFGRRSPNESVF